MCKLRHKLCNAKKGVRPTFTWLDEALCMEITVLLINSDSIRGTGHK